VNRILKAIKAIEKQVGEFKIPWVTEVSKRKDPIKSENPRLKDLLH